MMAVVLRLACLALSAASSKAAGRRAAESRLGRREEPQAEAEAGGVRFPPCRKSGNIFTMAVADAGNASLLHPRIQLSGGKGQLWRERGSGSHRRRAHAKVKILGDTWLFDPVLRKWQEPELRRDIGAPVARWKSAGATFDGDSKLAIFGGCEKTHTQFIIGDLWVFEPACCPEAGGWRRVETANPPRKRRGHVMAANATHLIVHGGKTYHSQLVTTGASDDGKVPLTDLWALPLAALRSGAAEPGVWTRGAEFPRSGFWGSSGSLLTSPEGRGVLAVFGGRIRIESPNATNAAARLRSSYAQASWRDPKIVYYSSLWLYDLAEDKWTLARPKGAVPRPRDHHGAAVLGGDLFIFAGRLADADEASSDIGDVWSYSLAANVWREHTPSAGFSPKPRYMAGATAFWLGGREVLAIFGGKEMPGDLVKTAFNDVWVFDPIVGRWELLSPSLCSAWERDTSGWTNAASLPIAEESTVDDWEEWLEEDDDENGRTVGGSLAGGDEEEGRGGLLSWPPVVVLQSARL